MWFNRILGTIVVDGEEMVKINIEFLFVHTFR